MRRAIATVLMLTGSVLSGYGMTRTETWENAGDPCGWVCYDALNERLVNALSVNDQALAVRFPAQGMKMPPEEYLVKAGGEASGGAFAGDWQSIGARTITLRLFLEQPGPVSLVIGGAGKWWRCRLDGLTTGTWQTVEVSVDPERLSSLSAVDNGVEFAAMLRAVEWVGVLFRRHPVAAAYTCRIASFKLSAAGTGYGEWIAGFGRHDVERLATRSISPAGIRNFEAWIAGTPPDDPAAAFRVLAVTPRRQATGDAVRIEWASVAGREYQVLRAARPDGPFEAVSGWLPAVPDVNAFDDASAAGPLPAFYQVNVRLEE